MVDTVKYQLETRIHPLPKCKGWKAFSYSKTDGVSGYGCIHIQTGLKIQDVFQKTYVEASLPRLLFQTNKHLLTSQEHINKAFERADALVSELNPFSESPFARASFSRIDLAWQIKGKAKDVIYSLMNFEYPGIRKAPVIYVGETISWISKKKISLSIYDKEREQNKRRKTPGDILRIELRLQGKKIGEHFNVKPLKELIFSDCYRVFREAVLKLNPKPLPRLTSMNHIFKYAIDNNWKINGIPAVHVILKDLVTEQRIRKNVTRLQLKKIRLDLEKEFPPGKPRTVKRGNGYDYSTAQMIVKIKRRPKTRNKWFLRKSM